MFLLISQFEKYMGLKNSLYQLLKHFIYMITIINLIDTIKMKCSICYN